jgi:hypothetical protein
MNPILPQITGGLGFILVMAAAFKPQYSGYLHPEAPLLRLIYWWDFRYL